MIERRARWLMKSKRPPTVRVAEVRTTVANFSKSCSRRILADVNRRSGEKNASVAALHPVNVIVFGGFEARMRVPAAKFETAAGDIHKFFGFVGDRGDFGFEGFQRRRRDVVGFAILFEEGVAFGAFEGKRPSRWRESCRRNRGRDLHAGYAGATTGRRIRASCEACARRRERVHRSGSLKFRGQNNLWRRLRFRGLRRKSRHRIREECWRNRPGEARDRRKTNDDSR